MTMNQPEDASKADRSPEEDARKPFVAPALRREADLVDRTADRFFTFQSHDGS